MNIKHIRQKKIPATCIAKLTNKEQPRSLTAFSKEEIASYKHDTEQHNSEV